MNSPNASLSPEQILEMVAQEAAVEAIQWEQNRQDRAIKDRAELTVRCAYSLEERAAELVLCREDIFHWLDNWCWIEEPRADVQEIPFLRYDFQTEFIQWVVDNVAETLGTIKKKTLLIEKSRDMGVSWTLIAVAVWYWLFHNRSSLFGSRKAELADKLGDMKTLLEKARFIIRRLPEWMWPIGFDQKEDMGHNLIKNPNGGAITAEASCVDFGRGDRKLFIVLDEFASWPYDDAAAKSAGGSSSVLIFVSTPKGPYNKFARMARGEDDVTPLIKTLHWTQHPIKAAGMSMDHAGKPTSPWYREQCNSGTFSADDIASEFDLNYAHSTKGLVFPDYVANWHRMKLIPDERSPIIRVWDPGVKTFYVLFCQVDKDRRILCLDEVCITDANLHDVAQEVLRVSNERFRRFNFLDCGDPAGSRITNSLQESPEFETLRDEYDIDIDVSFMDGMRSDLKVKSRITAIHNKLRELNARTNTPGLLIDHERCPTLDRAMLEGYRYKVDKHTKRVSEIVDEEHPWEDAVDCLGMGILYKLGLGTNKQGSKKVEIEKNVIRWPGQMRRQRIV